MWTHAKSIKVIDRADGKAKLYILARQDGFYEYRVEAEIQGDEYEGCYWSPPKCPVSSHQPKRLSALHSMKCRGFVNSLGKRNIPDPTVEVSLPPHVRLGSHPEELALAAVTNEGDMCSPYRVCQNPAVRFSASTSHASAGRGVKTCSNTINIKNAPR
jgi:hypothetical protein